MLALVFNFLVFSTTVHGAPPVIALKTECSVATRQGLEIIEDENFYRAEVNRLREHLDAAVIGQKELTRDAVLALLVGGHVLFEGPHGTAKTLLSNTLAKSISGSAKRIQFTSDLMPGDITGSTVFDHDAKKRIFYEGPIFANIFQGEEINRAPPKTQSALFEAMEEKQVTSNGETHPLPGIFIVIATQNPLHQLGTYNLPEAVLDRFLLASKSSYLEENHERQIVDMKLSLERNDASFGSLTLQDIEIASHLVEREIVPAEVRAYVTKIIDITRHHETFPILSTKLLAGVSNRGTMALIKAGQANAWLRGSNAMSVEDVDAIAHDVLRHRLILTADAKADSVDPDALVNTILAIAHQVAPK